MIQVDGVSKVFRTRQALRNVGLRVAEGEVCGLIGPNGAGKTTLLRILATVLPPTSGKVWIAGFNLRRNPEQIRWRIGYMPDSFAIYEELRVDTYLELFASIYRLPRERTWQTIDDVLRLVDLVELRNAPVSSLSLGARQRLGFGRLLLHNPDVLLLDEPVSGLDPRARMEMREFLKELGRMGKTVLISSHVLSDLADLCDRVVILEVGEVVFAGTVEELKKRARVGCAVELAVDGDPAKIGIFLREQTWAKEVHSLKDGHFVVTISGSACSLAQVSGDLFKAGFRVTKFLERDVHLEEAFLRLTTGQVS